MKRYFEIFITDDNIELKDWHSIISEISKFNGFLSSWKLYIKIENNLIRYFLETNVKIPSVLSYSNKFVIRSINDLDTLKKKNKWLYFVKNSESSIADIYDRNDSKKSRDLKQIEIKIKYLTPKVYLTSTFFYFTTLKNKLKKYKALFFIPAYHLKVDFGQYTRFLCNKQDGRRYLKVNKSVQLFSNDIRDTNLLEVDAFPFFQEKKYLSLENYDFEKHSLIVGASGTGKSKFLASFIKNIHDNYCDLYKIVMIDPHGAIEEEIGGIDQSFVIDMQEPNSTADILINSKTNANVNTEILLSTFKNIFGDEYNSKLERVLRHSIYVLLKNEILNFRNLKKLITEVEYRNKILRESLDLESHVKEFFLTDFLELKNHSYSEAISPIVSLIDEIQMLPGFADVDIKLKIEDIIQNNILTLFSLNQAKLGEKVINIISNLVLGVIFQLVQRNYFDKHLIFIIDEFAIVQNPILSKLLSEARKYNLSLFLVEQYLSQVSEEIQNSIYSNVMNYYCFRVSRDDAKFMSGTLQMEMAVQESYLAKIRLLSELPNRDLIVRVTKDGQVIPGFRCRTLEFKKIPRIKHILNTIKESGKKIINKISFELGKVRSVSEIMKSQSTARSKKNHFHFF